MSSKSALQKCFARVSHRSVKQECPTRVPSKSVSQECQVSTSIQGVLHKCHVRVCPKGVEYVCHVRKSHESVARCCQVGAASRGVPQVCPENVTSVVFVYYHTCQHSGLWVSSCFRNCACRMKVFPVWFLGFRWFTLCSIRVTTRSAVLLSNWGGCTLTMGWQCNILYFIPFLLFWLVGWTCFIIFHAVWDEQKFDNNIFLVSNSLKTTNQYWFEWFFPLGSKIFPSW